MLHYFWEKRYLLLRLVRRMAGWFVWLYRLLPLSKRSRIIMKNMVFGGLDMLIFQSGSFQHWRNSRAISNPTLMAAGEGITSHLPKAPAPTAPSDEMWQSIPVSSQPETAVMVDVIVPVYKGYVETLNCIYTALHTPLKTRYELIVINDASPDERLAEKLRELAAQGKFTLLENEQNLGFVATVNRGMQVHPDRDVVLLNSDTEVYNDWLDRLYTTSRSQAKVASVTPFSNNAEICSYPAFVKDNEMALSCGYAALDAFAAEVNKGRTCHLPTAVGFCMYIPREALTAVGYFDVETFGKGYGEENDFCLRASAKGYVHLLAADVFVRHLGGTSFEQEKQPKIANAMRIINHKYPHYAEQVSAFIASDPAHPYRVALDLARLLRGKPEKTMLFISHILGGGTERHVQDMAGRLEAEGYRVCVLRPVANTYSHVALVGMDEEYYPNLVFSLDKDMALLCDVLKHIAPEVMHVHHVIGFHPDFSECIRYISRQTGTAYDVTVHDYYYVCPRINLIDRSGLYCGEPELATCESCISTTPSFAAGKKVWQWRQAFSLFLESARNLYVPNRDVAQRMQKYVPDKEFLVRPHMEIPEQMQPPESRKPGEVLRVALIGALGVHKGSSVLAECAKDALKRSLPIEFHVFGSANNADELTGCKNVIVHGEYKEGQIYNLLSSKQCHVSFFASVWPETYCYTLSIAINAGIFPVAFDMGAIAERLRGMGWGELLPMEYMHRPSAINDRLLAMQITSAPEHARLEEGKVLYPDMAKDYYQLVS